MIATQSEAPLYSINSNSTEALAQKVLAYEAPFLIEKLLKEKIVATAPEGEALFAELKKFLVLVHLDRSRIWDMYSLRIDEVWHQFILFTRQYMNFCQQYFDRYVPHSPSNAPEELLQPDQVTSFTDFQCRYTELFGESLPDVWYDERSIMLDRRVLNDYAEQLVLRNEGNGMVSLLLSSDEMLLSVSEFARNALVFIAQTGAFYVREVPDLKAEEKIGLVATLVEYNILRVGS
jgi:hypothetical protein